MADVSLLPAIRLTTEVERSLVEVADRRMLTPAREAGYELALAGATILPQKKEIVRTPRGCWLFVDHHEDPTAEEYDGYIPIPEEPLARLAEMDRHGISPELIWIAHQLPSDYREGDPLPKLVPTPRHLRQKDERLKLVLGSATTLFLAGAAALIVGTASLPLALVGAVGLDPIVFGGVKHPELPIVAWYVLDSWDWE